MGTHSKQLFAPFSPSCTHQKCDVFLFLFFESVAQIVEVIGVLAGRSQVFAPTNGWCAARVSTNNNVWGMFVRSRWMAWSSLSKCAGQTHSANLETAILDLAHKLPSQMVLCWWRHCIGEAKWRRK